MGTTLTGTTPQDTYDSLIKVTDNGPISGTLKALSDGLGNDSTLSLSTTAASIAGTLAVTGNATFDTNTLVVDATNNRVGVGLASPTTNFEVQNAAAGAAVKVSNSGGGSAQLAVSSNATSIATLSFTNSLTLSGGVVSVSDGIQFPATQVASANANTLDDYEEGTWTPTLVPDGAGAITLVTQFGKYTKIGNMVTLNGFVSWSTNTGTGQAKLTGLPFSVNNSTTPIANQVAIHEQNGGVGQGVHFRHDNTTSTANGYSYNFDGTAATCLSFGVSGYIGINATYFV